jgi:hypothetical protein
MIEQFVKFQPKTCGDVTISIYLHHLSLALKSMYPARDWSWLVTISERFAARGKEKRKKYNLVTSETLYALGIALMDGALSRGNRSRRAVSRPPTATVSSLHSSRSFRCGGVPSDYCGSVSTW